MLWSGLTLDLDVTLFVVLILFLIPLAVLNSLVFGPFLKMFEKRYDQVEGASERADQQLARAEDRAKEFESRIKVATEKGIEARDRIRAEAAAKMAERIAAEKKKLDEKLAKALEEIQVAKDLAMSEVASESRQLAEMTAKKLLGRGL